MAYNKVFNPDKLPSFAEPERRVSAPTTQADLSSYMNKPPPPLPQSKPMKQSLNYRYSQTSRPPVSPTETEVADRRVLWELYQAVDKNGNCLLSEKELRQALVNGDWTLFDPYTVKMMIRLFDTNQNGGINFEEFCGLWSFLGSWRSIFDRFDSDKSGNISINEYANALIAFGYRLSDKFVYMLFKKYDKRGVGAISFDLFVQSCISLKRMTNVFKKYDDDRDGYITLSFEDFLTEVIEQR
ncbi:putative calcium binding modulator protein [Erysiphe necator]|uniref:Putative calcium binding modulator protein n=1 Tax=Uncinula necator TaxID=52586 RepID=A0A0B1P7G6_UNCNE|nr:putative calcium binding modulator protein [Erysiphe necator]